MWKTRRQLRRLAAWRQTAAGFPPAARVRNQWAVSFHPLARNTRCGPECRAPETARKLHPPETDTLTTSPGSHSAVTSKGRQQTSQSVTKHWEGMLVSSISSMLWPQKGQSKVAVASM